jgi:hypothetical protein
MINSSLLLHFFAQQFMGVQRSHIEIGKIFNVASIIDKFATCQLGVQNLNKLVMILKNWPNDVRRRCILALKGM